MSDLFSVSSQPVQPSVRWLSVRRVRLMGGLAVMGLVLLTVRGLYLQVSHSAALRRQAEENRIRLLIEYAPRGTMFDRFGTQLVQNVPTTDLVVYPTQLPSDTQQLISALHEIFPSLSPAEFQERLSHAVRTSPKPIPLLADITHDQHIMVLARSDRLPGIHVESRAVRAYTGGGIFAHVLGYTGRMTEEDLQENPTYLLTESIGKSGIEQSYERTLRGSHGARRVEVDAAGNPQSDLGTLPAKPGTNLRLHLDATLQERLAEALSESLRKAGVRKGAAIALDPRTGAVRALVSLPSFDHAALARGIRPADAQALFGDPDQPLLNRTLQGLYPPGSTFKLAVAVGAAEEGIITAETSVESRGGIRVGPWFFPDWKSGGHGSTDLIKALAESVNTFFYIAGGGIDGQQGLGIEGITTWARRLGFGNATEIDLPGEGEGFLPSKQWKQATKKEPWYIGDTYHASIGQGDILATPLQLAVLTATIANGGTLYTPRIVDALVRSDGSPIETLPSEERATKVFRPAIGNLIRRGMREAVLSGSAHGLQGIPVAIAAKTGTAQTSNSEKTHAWITSFAPYENPEIVLTILIEEGGAGDRVAVPIARDIYTWYFSPERQATIPTNSF